MSGRHLVQSEVDGAWASAGWVDVHSGPIEVAAVEQTAPVVTPRRPGPPRPDPSVGRNARKQQLGRQLKAVHPCVRRLDKEGIEDTFVEIELSVDANGAIRFANVIDTDLPASMSKCVRDAVAAMRFPAGAAVTWRETIHP